ncbi:DUF11 domain-containing protein [Diaphorobacter sp. HDW4B]|uniref:DUF11 domain-containing protein n=1 Tax=Diaphorobacter sp. HDW4B TaxID=2714925 RepID=UPI00140BCE85|nr:DUF11 domain-containing protein [Diaphorobacter sp. HDW4B]QIL69905.1 DUF11 domain-containing protein [Diaphorobacter sp. HDW4B]
MTATQPLREWITPARVRSISRHFAATCLKDAAMAVLAGCLLWLLLGWSGNVHAEGSRTLHPSGETNDTTGRAVMGLSTNNTFHGVVSGRQFFYVYAQKDEHILLGSRNRSSAGKGEIKLYSPQSFGSKGLETIPGTATFTCTSAKDGLIETRNAELAGPLSVSGSNGGNADRYKACSYKAPTTGIYGVLFGGDSGSGALIDPPSPQSNAVSAWDVTVRSSDTTSLVDINGRVFTYAWTVATGNNSGAASDLTNRAYRIATTLYYVSSDGYRYKQQFVGIDPNGAAFYANSKGFLDTNGSPLYRDYRGTGGAVTGGASGTAGIKAQAPEYPIFFSDVSQNGPNAAEVARVLTALSFPLAPKTPVLTNPAFVGNFGNNSTTVSSGGSFTFSVQNTQTYQIVISRNGTDFDPANTQNRVLTGIAETGDHNILWDGRDNNGNSFPAGNYKYQIVGRNGEIHFPMADVEGNVNGGPILTKLNGPSVGDNTVYYDDRGYKTANGTVIGTLNGHLCGSVLAGKDQVQPSPVYSLIGLNSSTVLSGSGSSSIYYRKWAGSNNANTDCTASDQYFGDGKGLDLWALEKSQVFIPTIEILEPSTPVDVSTQVSVTPSVLSGGTAYGSFSFNNAGSAPATGVTYQVTIGTLGGSGVTKTCPAAVTFTLLPTGVMATYSAATCKVSFSGMPTTLTVGQTLLFNFNYVVAAGNPGPIPITTVIAATNETANAPAPNTDTAQTTVAVPVVNVSKSANPAAGSAVPVGSTITYVLSADVSNAPLTSALSLADTLGAGLQFGSIVSNSPALVCTGSLNCSLPSGTGIGTYSVTYTATVLASAGATVNNSVVASGGGSTPICNSCSVTNTVQRTRLTVSKNMAGRLLSTDQFTVSISGGVASNTSSGNANSVSTGAVDVNAGTAYTLSEAAAGSPLADLSRYTSTFACTNATAGGTAVPASGTGTSVSVTPQAGDEITCTFTNTPKYPNIAATKTASPTTLVAGASNQKYQINVVVTNGPTTETIALTDTLPTGVTLSGAPQLTGGGTLASCGNTSGSAIGPNCTLASGLANGTYTIDIPVQVASTAVAGGASNTAHLSGGGDPACTSSDTKCNPSTGTVTVVQKADLRIEKTATPDGSYVPDQSLNYQIVVTNDGPSDVDGASIQDTVPSKVNVSLWSCTPATGADCGANASGTDNNVSLTGVKIPAGKSVTITVTGMAQRSATGDIINTATVTPPTSTPCATTACVLTDTVTNQNSGKPVLVIDKQATPSAFAVGGRGLYTITVKNTGTGSTSGVITVTDTMPAGITIDTTKVTGENWNCQATTSTQLSCFSTVALLPQSVASVINAEVLVGNAVGATASNTAQVVGGGSDCGTSLTCTDSVTTNVDRPKLKVSKQVENAFVVGVQTSYFIDVTNEGNANTLGGTITDTVPADLVIGTLDAAGGCSVSGQVVTCAVPSTLAPGQTKRFVIPVTPLATANGKTLTNQATADNTTGDLTCPSDTGCVGITNDPVSAPQLELKKETSPVAFTVGVQARYLLTLKNTGTATTTLPATITDVVPSGLRIDGFEPAGACAVDPADSQKVTCTVAAGLAVDQETTVAILVTPQASVINQSLRNQATATGGGDPLCVASVPVSALPASCAPVVTTPVNAPQLKITKTTDAGTQGFKVGVLSNYILTVTNIGTAPTAGLITVIDEVPAHLTLGTMPTGCTRSGQSVRCESSAVLAAATDFTPAGFVRFTIPVTPTAAAASSIPPTVTNKAVVYGGGDPLCPANKANCESTTVTTVNAPQLQISKQSNTAAWEVGQSNAQYQLTVSNASTLVATIGEIAVVDELPMGITPKWVGTLMSGAWNCTANGQTVNCTSNASIAASGSASITLPVNVLTTAISTGVTGSVTNHASVAGGGDPFNGGMPPAPGTACTALDAGNPGHCANTSTTVNMPAALGITKVFNSMAQTSLGQYQATYTVTVSNTGGLPGTYTLTDTPAFAAGTVLNGWTVNSTNGSVNAPLPALINGATHQISATATAIAAGGTHSYVVVIAFTASPSTAATSLTCSGTLGHGAYNAASIGSAAPAASACGNLPGLPNLTLAKSSNGPWSAGQTGAQYVLTVTNVGNAVTSGTTKVVDTLPTGVSAVNTTSNGWTCTVIGQTVTCETTAALAVGTPSLITLPVTLSSTLVSSTGVVNVASVGGGGDPNNGGEPPVPGTCAVGDLHCASVTTPVGLKADLRITKVSEQGTQYVPNQPLNYTIEVFNDGPSSISGASVLDVVPVEVEVSAWSCVATGTGSCGANATGTTNNVSLTGVALAMGEKLTITITGTAARNATGDIVNKATVTPPTGVTCTTTPCEKESPPVTSKNAGTPALVIEKEAAPTTFAVGQNGIYSLKVRNNGTNSTSGAITVTDRMPAGITITSIEPNSVWTCSVASGTDLTCTTSDVLLPNVSAPVIIAHVAVANTVVTPAVNTASVTGGSTACTTQSPCSVTVQTNVDRPQLAVSKKLDSSFVVGQPTSYTITVENKGQAATLAGTITDTVPLGLAVGDLTNSGCSANGNVVTCNVSAGMLPGSSKSFTIPVTPLASADGTSQVNKAIANSDTGDSTCPSELHCTGKTDDPVTAPKLEMTKTANAGAFTVGQAASYTLTVTNNGTAATTGVITITDVVPAGLTIDSVTPTSATCAAVAAGSQTVTCTVSALAVKASASIVIGVTPKASADKQTMVNQAGVTGGGDPLCVDGTATASLPTRCAPTISTPVNAPHLLLEKSTGMTEFSVGVASTYVLKVTNVGTAATSGKITVVDTLPASMTLGDLTSEPGCSATGTLVKQLTCESSASLAVNASVTFRIPVTPTAAAAPNVTNNAQAYGGGDPLCPMDASCKSSITTVVNAPDLHIVKTDNGPWVVGQADAAYTLTVNNSSAIAASVGEILINVKDVMPLGIEPKWTDPLVSANWSCSFVSRSVTCHSIHDLVIGAGQSSSIVLPVNVTTAALAGGLNADVTNHASVSGGGDPFNDGDAPEPGTSCLSLDPNDPGHCAQKITRIFALADLVVSKSNPTFTATGVAGQYVAEYQIDVTNLGGVDGHYTLSDTPGFPADVVLNSWTARVSSSAIATPLTPPVNGALTQISAANEVLPVGATHSYVVALTFTMQAGVTQVACTGSAGSGAFNAASIVGTTATDASGCAALPGVPSLGLVKTSNGPWTVDQTGAKYTMTVTNHGTASTNGSVMTVSDNMPTGLTATAGSSNGWTCGVAGQQVSCTNASVLAAGVSSVIELPVKVTSAAVGNPSNLASVGGGGDPYNGGNPPVPGSCAAGDMHCASVPTKVNALADPMVTKTNNQTSLVVGSTTTYTVTISNPGTTDATGISWTDTVVSGLKDVSIVGSTASSGSNAGSCAGLTCTGITVAAGGNVVYKVTATVSGKAGEQAENTATVTGGTCLTSSPCTSTDSDPIVNEPQDAVAVPVDSRTMLVLLALAMVGLAYRQTRRARR